LKNIHRINTFAITIAQYTTLTVMLFFMNNNVHQIQVRMIIMLKPLAHPQILVS